MKNVITFLVSSVILTVLVYLYFYATNGDNAMQEMEAYKDWIAVAVILLSIAVAFVAAKIRRRREDELDFGYRPASRVQQPRVSQSTYHDNDQDNDQDNDCDTDTDTDTDNDNDQDVEVSRVTQSRVSQLEDDTDGFYDHTAFVQFEVGDDEPYEDFVNVGVEDDEFEELSEAQYNGLYLDMDYVAENHSSLHDRIIVAIRQRVMDDYYNLINSDHKNFFYPDEYPLDSLINYVVLDLE